MLVTWHNKTVLLILKPLCINTQRVLVKVNTDGRKTLGLVAAGAQREKEEPSLEENSG
jgi:hypothetical protein